MIREEGAKEWYGGGGRIGRDGLGLLGRGIRLGKDEVGGVGRGYNWVVRGLGNGREGQGI